MNFDSAWRPLATSETNLMREAMIGDGFEEGERKILPHFSSDFSESMRTKGNPVFYFLISFPRLLLN
jgi:hypothetical protein